jgi:hypothetical protein
LGSASSSRRLDTIARAVLLLGMSALLIRCALVSLDWSYAHDFPLLHYAAWLFGTQGAIPYENLFEFNMPGTYLVHLGMGACVGWDPDGVRVFDLLWLAATLSAVAWVLSRFGRWAAWGGAVAVGLGYLGHGPMLSLQREWLMMLPLLIATGLSLREGPRVGLRALLVGALIGFAATIKPHVLIVLPVFVVFDATRLKSGGRGLPARLAASLAILLAGVAIPVAMAMTWVFSLGGLSPFWDILTGYTPLYASLTGKHYAVAEGQRLPYVLKEFVLRERTWIVLGLTVPGLLLATWGERRRDVRRAAWLLGAMTAALTLYPLPAGKLWPYHFLPQETFAVVAAALVLTWRPEEGARRRLLATVLLFAAVLGAAATRSLEPRAARDVGKARDIAAYLEDNLKPGERVQPLDWTDGAAHAMLLARAPIATRFLYAFHFQHHVSTDYIQNLRAAFLEQLSLADPPYVLRMTACRRPHGVDTSEEFPELEILLNARYDVAVKGPGYEILARKGR